MNGLTDKFIKSLQPKKQSYYQADTTAKRGVGRLVVKVYPSGKKAFFFRYYKNKERQFISIGNYPTTKLTYANNIASFYTKQLTEGLDPLDFIKQELEQKELEQQAKKKLELRGSVRQLFEAYTNDMKKSGKRSYKTVMDSLERDAIPILGEDTKANEVTTDDIKLVIARVIQRGAPVQSNRLRSYLMSAYNFGIRHDNDPAYMDRPKLFGIEYNPVLGIPRQNVERAGERDLSADEIRTFWQDMSKGGFMKETEICLKLCFTTGGQRPNEILWADWDEINFGKGILDLPSSKTKNKRAHVVPLTPMALNLLKELYLITGDTPHLFPSRYDRTIKMATNSIGRSVTRYCDKEEIDGVPNPFYENRFTARDIRRTVKTRMGEIGIGKEIRDRIANHALNDVSSKHYDRYDYLREKRAALDTWCNWLAKNIM